MKAIIIGSTGLTGNLLLLELLENPLFTEVLSISRSSTKITHPKLKELIINLRDILNYQDQIKGDHFFCCIGTTIKKAGSKENFWKVDFEIPFYFSRIAKSSNAKSFSFISAHGANPDSLFYYNQVKGKIEGKLREVDLESLIIYRPGLLIGQRSEKRFSENLGVKLIDLLKNILPKYKITQFSTQADKLARKMNENCDKFKGVRIIESEDI